jgi:hypothetical protein
MTGPSNLLVYNKKEIFLILCYGSKIIPGTPGAPFKPASPLSPFGPEVFGD